MMIAKVLSAVLVADFSDDLWEFLDRGDDDLLAGLDHRP